MFSFPAKPCHEEKKDDFDRHKIWLLDAWIKIVAKVIR